MMKPLRNDTKLTQKSKKSVQVVLKIPEAFMKRFDYTSEMLGYSRTEAVKEAMRRFQELNEQKVMQRPENASAMIREMMSAVLTPIIQIADKAEESEKLRQKTIDKLPEKI